jgi:site-specific DNA-methyltransferase (adenine-specific)
VPKKSKTPVARSHQPPHKSYGSAGKPEVRSRKTKSFYKSPPPKPAEGVTGDEWHVTRKKKTAGRAGGRPQGPRAETTADFSHPHFIAPSHFTLREDGTIETKPPIRQQADANSLSPGGEGQFPRPRERERVAEGRVRDSGKNQTTAGEGGPSLPKVIYKSDSPFIRLYHGNCLELLDAIAAKYPEGRFDAIFADPPYFLSNGGITCHAGKMVKVDKGDWDVSRGPELNHEFNTEWLRRCQRVLKPIFSIGYALQQLGFKILNDIAWEKPNPPPNLSCRYFTHSTETVLWAAKNGKSKHVFNYPAMKAVTGKQMKTVWTMNAPSNGEKAFGKHPTQKPVALVERCLLASTSPGDLVLDPFLGGGTTAVAAVRIKRGCVGIEMDEAHVKHAEKRIKAEIEKMEGELFK